jgi:hypothetical protein
MLKRRGQISKKERNLASNHIVEGGSASLVRDVNHIDTGGRLEQCARQMLSRSIA